MASKNTTRSRERNGSPWELRENLAEITQGVRFLGFVSGAGDHPGLPGASRRRENRSLGEILSVAVAISHRKEFELRGSRARRSTGRSGWSVRQRRAGHGALELAVSSKTYPPRGGAGDRTFGVDEVPARYAPL